VNPGEVIPISLNEQICHIIIPSHSRYGDVIYVRTNTIMITQDNIYGNNDHQHGNRIDINSNYNYNHTASTSYNNYNSNSNNNNDIGSNNDNFLTDDAVIVPVVHDEDGNNNNNNNYPVNNNNMNATTAITSTANHNDSNQYNNEDSTYIECHTCTYHNELNRSKCQMCESILDQSTVIVPTNINTANNNTSTTTTTSATPIIAESTMRTAHEPEMFLI